MNVLSEHWRKADETVEVCSKDLGNLIVFIKDGDAIIFGSLWDFVRYNQHGEQITRVYCSEDDLSTIYEKYDSFEDLLNSNDYDIARE